MHSQLSGKIWISFTRAQENAGAKNSVYVETN
jgi:hypothetical protein